ncbi:MAG: hypothetical protein NC084_09650 [Bacteroides sp.]|nr:hypothetical protein [Eubacterium sp.]MCM1462961.1 hypothetical protein [Bacteroides sp.]
MTESLFSAVKLLGVESPINPVTIVIIVVAAVAIVGSVVFGVISKKKKK